MRPNRVRAIVWLIALMFVIFPPEPSAQEGAPAPRAIKQDMEVFAVGGFLGQLDGFCENPGGTYDLLWLEENKSIVQRCPAADGSVPSTRPTDRVALGGVLGAGTWLRQRTASTEGSRLVVITGNNQIANFGALGSAALELPAGPARTEALKRPLILSETSPASQTSPMVQAQARLARFWEAVGDLTPDIVAMGTEDFVRSLRAIDSLRSERPVSTEDLASVLTQWISRTTAGDSGLPLIASNVTIRLRTEGRHQLNRVQARAGLFRTQHFELAGMDADESVGWLEEVKVTHPADATLLLSLCVVTTAAVPVCDPAVHPAAGATSTTLTPGDGTLRPDTRYQVDISGPRLAEPVRLAFSTHQALTPRAGNPALFAGFPLVARTHGWPKASKTTAPWPHDGPLLLVSLVDPGAKERLLGKEAWKWRGVPCPTHVTECEIDILPPIDTLHAIAARVVAARIAKPFIVVVSDLEDADTQAVLDAFPEVRMMLLPPDSRMLGRASRASPARDNKDLVIEKLSERTIPPGESPVRYSGDLGFAAVVNEDPEAATILARPEWIGETGGRLRATMSSSTRGEWLLEQPRAQVETIAGAALAWRVAPCVRRSGGSGPCVYYRARWDGLDYDYGTFEAYVPCAQGDASDRCNRFRELVTSRKAFDTAAGDLLRRAVRAELAIVPGALLDEDFASWLGDLLTPPLAPTDFLSRLMLERAIYRSSRFVRATVQGDKLLDTLKKAVASEAEVSGSACVVGLDSKVCQPTIDPDRQDTFLVNGRQVDPRLFYSIAMPDSLAEALSLPHGDREKDSHDAITALHDGVGAGAWYVASPDGTLSGNLLRRGRRTLQSDVIASALQIGVTSVTLGTPAGRGDVLQGLDVPFSSTTPSRTWVVKSDLDVALVDTWWSAVRVVSAVDYNERTDLSKTPREVTYTANTWTYGARLDLLKWRPFDREVRPYVGWFTERAIKGPSNTYRLRPH